MVLRLEDAVTILSKWKDDSAHVLVVSESPFQQSRRGIVEQGIDWVPCRGKCRRSQLIPIRKGKKARTVVFETPGGTLSLSIGGCCFVYQEPREAKPVLRES
jgi:hypothetical protein